ncbi:MAG: prephenate dehydrogenase/arogenate dehydrogenase family protein [Tenericutes bacterium]|nr:prephenate dehydrogenase/arogenate dehydrogenase family protein [Mycoplasmatota bacterium]
MKIGIVGLGLIGGTIAKSLNMHHFISGYDTSSESIAFALDNKIIHKAYENISDFWQDNDVVYLCIYPNSMKNFIFRNAGLMSVSSIIIEISGIKEELIKELESVKPENVDIIYTHPIAGSEKVGIYNSNENIFKSANYVITPIESNGKGNLELAENLAKEMGFANISYINPSDHDEIIAYTSQLTHVLSLSLVNSLSTDLDTSKFIGNSYRDLTRISMINEKLWSELFIANKDHLLVKIEKFEKELIIIKEAISTNNVKKLEEIMIKSTIIRSDISKGDDDES